MNSSDYWRLREEKQHAKNIKDEKEYDKKIKEIYSNMLDDIQKQIDSFYVKYAKDENITMAEAKKRASKLDIETYARKAKKYVQEKNFSKQANEEMKLYNLTMKVNRLELLKANIGLVLASGHDDLDKYMNELLENRAIDELERQAGILGSTIQNNAEMAHSIVNASFHNATYSDRIWMHHELLKNDLDKLLAIGLIQGRNPNELARDLRKRFKVKISDAQRLMRTELARVQIGAQMKEYEANDIDEFEYIACGNGDVCDTCLALDGKIFKVKKMQPGTNAPPMHPNCHCSTGPHMDRKIYDEWLDGLANGKHSLRLNEYKQLNQTEMYRHKGYTHRKVGSNGFKIIDKALYNRITKPAIKAGADIRIADEQWRKHLAKVNASAVTIGDTIIFSENATVSDVLEEVHHFYQNKAGMNAELNVKMRTILNEIDAKKYLLESAKKYKIPLEEIELTRYQLESYTKEMETLKKAGEWDEDSKSNKN